MTLVVDENIHFLDRVAGVTDHLEPKGLSDCAMCAVTSLT